MKKPKEIRDLDKQFEAALIVVRDLFTRAMELGEKDLEEAAGRAHDALIDYKLTRDPMWLTVKNELGLKAKAPK